MLMLVLQSRMLLQNNRLQLHVTRLYRKIIIEFNNYEQLN